MGYLTLTQMASMVADRFTIGIDSSVIVGILNQLHFQYEMMPLKWNIVQSNLDFTAGSTEITATLPAAADVGMPMYLSGDLALGYGVEIPYKPFEQAFRLRKSYGTILPGQLSFWTFVSDGTTGFTAYVYPFEAFSANYQTTKMRLSFGYHQVTQANVDAASRFNWPMKFDFLLVDLCEAELKRIHNIAGWETAKAKAENQLQAMLDKYISPNQNLLGLALATRQAQELQAESRPR